MGEGRSDLETRLVAGLQAYAGRSALFWAPRAVVADVMARRPARSSPWRNWSLAASAVVAAVLVVGIGLWAVRSSPSGSYPAMVSVNGVDYLVGVGRGLRVVEAELVRFGDIRVGPYGMPLNQFADRIAFRLSGVDPREALVARQVAGLSDDAGPYDGWWILWGPDARGTDAYSAALCGHFDLEHPASAGFRCHEPTPGSP